MWSMLLWVIFFLFFKQKTAYEMRISDWSSDVCSSDLTIAVYLVISPVFVINWQVLSTGTNSISSLIALKNGEANDFEVSALMAAGLVLFLRSEERRVGEEGVSTCKSRCAA